MFIIMIVIATIVLVITISEYKHDISISNEQAATTRLAEVPSVMSAANESAGVRVMKAQSLCVLRFRTCSGLAGFVFCCGPIHIGILQAGADL